MTKKIISVYQNKMSTLQTVKTTRIRKPQPAEEIQTPLAGSPVDTTPTFELPPNYKEDRDFIERVEKDVEIAKSKERQEVVRKVIKRRVQKEGAVKAFTQIDGYLPSEFQKFCEEHDKNAEHDMWGKTPAEKVVAFFVTLSPEPGSATAYQLHALMKQISVKKGTAHMIWSIENYGAKSEHPHAHALVYLNKLNQGGEPKRMWNAIQAVCKNYTKKTPYALQITGTSQKKCPDKVNYIKGLKVDKEKQKQVEKDKIWRKELDLQDWYMHPEVGQGYDSS